MMKKVLVTNDDGIDALGIRTLVKELQKVADVFVFAPIKQHSAKSHSITFLHEVGIEKREMEGALLAYAVEGTPVDCVKIGLKMMRETGIEPDYVMSGINLGLNTGLAAYYSGTVAGAREGVLNGVRSIALSVQGHEATEFRYMLSMLPRLMELSESVNQGTLLSVNVPELPPEEIKGMRVVPAAPFGYGVLYNFHIAESGKYQLGADPGRIGDEPRYDFDWVKRGYATVSPLPTTMQDPASLMKLKGQVSPTDVICVIVDAQTEVRGRIKKKKRFSRNIATFAHAASRMSIPTLLCETYGEGDVIPEAEPYLEDAERVERLAPDAWTAPDMETKVSAAGDCRVLIAGARTNVALMQTVFSFLERGYDVCVLEDCCSASSRASHRQAIEHMWSSGCKISDCETEMMQIAGGMDKEIYASVKRIFDNRSTERKNRGANQGENRI